MTQDISNTDNIIYIRDVIARVGELRETRDAYENPEGDLEAHGTHAEEMEELATLEAFLDECKGNGGDEQWNGDWYPVTLIRESYFQDYAQELAEEIGAVKGGEMWPNNCIDWEMAARELKYDYTGCDFGGVTYYAR